MIDINQMISDLNQMRDSTELRDTIGETKREIVAALIVAQAIHKNTIQQIHTYSAIQDLTSVLRDIIPLLREPNKGPPK